MIMNIKEIGLKGVIKNAKCVARHCGYDQVIFAERNNEYGFTRLYSNLGLYNIDAVIGIVHVDGRLNVTYNDNREYVNNKIKEYNVIFY